MADGISRTSRGKWAYSFRYGKSENYGAHLHMCIEIIQIRRGNVLYTVEGENYVLKPGDLIFTTPNEFHSFSFPKPCDYDRQFFHIYPSFIGTEADCVKSVCGKQPGRNNYVPAALVNKYRVYDIFEQIKRACTLNTKNLDAHILSYAIEMLATIDDIISCETIEPHSPSASKNVMRIMDYLNEHYTENITVQSLADYMYLDPSYISRQFRQCTGMTLKPYINMKRVALAKNMILSGRQPTDTYRECGFENYTTFYRVFKKYIGYTPEDAKRHAL